MVTKMLPYFTKYYGNPHSTNHIFGQDAKKAIEESRKISAGIEFSFSRQFFIRGGLSDGFGSFGLGIKNSGFMMDLTTYAVDLAESGYREDEDSRYLLTFSIGG